jgi:hypothetical protein
MSDQLPGIRTSLTFQVGLGLGQVKATAVVLPVVIVGPALESVQEVVVAIELGVVLQETVVVVVIVTGDSVYGIHQLEYSLEGTIRLGPSLTTNVVVVTVGTRYSVYGIHQLEYSLEGTIRLGPSLTVLVIGGKVITTGHTHCSVTVKYFAQLPFVSG